MLCCYVKTFQLLHSASLSPVLKRHWMADPSPLLCIKPVSSSAGSELLGVLMSKSLQHTGSRSQENYHVTACFLPYYFSIQSRIIWTKTRTNVSTNVSIVMATYSMFSSVYSSYSQYSFLHSFSLCRKQQALNSVCARWLQLNLTFIVILF